MLMNMQDLVHRQVHQLEMRKKREDWSDELEIAHFRGLIKEAGTHEELDDLFNNKILGTNPEVRTALLKDVTVRSQELDCGCGRNHAREQQECLQ